MVSGIILAGGSSTRYGTGENKTLVELLGRPVLEYSLRVFMAAAVVDEVVLAAKAGEEAALRKLAEGLCLQKPVTVVTGGADRAASGGEGTGGGPGRAGAHPRWGAAVGDRADAGGLPGGAGGSGRGNHCYPEPGYRKAGG